MVWPIDADNAKMLLDIPFPVNYVLIHLNPFFALQKLGPLTTQKSSKSGL